MLCLLWIFDGQRPQIFHVVGFVCNIDKDYSQEYTKVDTKDKKTKDHIAFFKDSKAIMANNHEAVANN